MKSDVCGPHRKCRENGWTPGCKSKDRWKRGCPRQDIVDISRSFLKRSWQLVIYTVAHIRSSTCECKLATLIDTGISMSSPRLALRTIHTALWTLDGRVLSLSEDRDPLYVACQVPTANISGLFTSIHPCCKAFRHCAFSLLPTCFASDQDLYAGSLFYKRCKMTIASQIPARGKLDPASSRCAKHADRGTRSTGKLGDSDAEGEDGEAGGGG